MINIGDLVSNLLSFKLRTVGIIVNISPMPLTIYTVYWFDGKYMGRHSKMHIKKYEQ